LQEFLLVLDHHFKQTWGSFGAGDGQFNRPRGLAIDSDGNVYVADSGNHRIQKFTSTGVFLKWWGGDGNGEGQFKLPIHIAIDTNNYVYVTEVLTGHGGPFRTRIQKFTHDGDFVRQWGEAGLGDGQFDSPSGIAVESDNDLLVVDSGNYRVQKFTSDGEFITKWGRYEPGHDLHLGIPVALTVDSNDNNYVTNAKFQQHLVKKFDRGGNFIRQWGLRGSGDGELDHPEEIATFTGGSLLVADSLNNRIQEFSSNGDFVTKWGSYGNQPNQFIVPTGVAINKMNDMHYISDTGNHRVQRFHWDPGVP
jgi:DNA-binding beta-propeller fold protein YncE